MSLILMGVGMEHDRVTVILIEDTLMGRRIVQKCLSVDKSILWLGAADDGGPGLELIRRSSPDVALVDFHLNHLGGLELISEINHQHPNTKVITFTQERNPFLFLQIFEAGSKAIYTKDFTHSLPDVIHHINTGGAFLDGYLVVDVINALKEREKLLCLNRNELLYIRAISKDKDNSAIASELGIQKNTVKKLLTTTQKKLGIQGKKGLIDYYRKLYPS